MTVVTIGDVMLDVYETGLVERVSPEAPVPVLHNPVGYAVLGGAANAARNVQALGVESHLVGAIGGDQAGERCLQLAAADNLSNGLVTFREWPTTVKHRFMSGGQQMLRVDTEQPLPGEHARILAGMITELSDGTDAIVISDYGKGVVSPAVAAAAIEAGRRAGAPVIVDSKCKDPSVFRGCYVITPNRLEATRMTGIEEPRAAAEAIARLTESSVIVTLGAEGMILLDGDRTLHLPSDAREVTDVTGAGDSVAAGIAVALRDGADLESAARFATAVAAVAVAHSGTYAVTRDDLAKA